MFNTDDQLKLIVVLALVINLILYELNYIFVISVCIGAESI